jgi:Transglycosylase SLT domain
LYHGGFWLKKKGIPPVRNTQKKSSMPLILALIIVCCVMYFFIMQPHDKSGKEPTWWTDFQKQVQQIQHPSSTPPTKSKPTGKQQKSTTLSGSCFDMARQAAQQAGIDPTLYARQINQESGCSNATSPAGAQGVAQLMPFMSDALGVNPHDVRQSLQAGARLMAGYLKVYNNSWALALACYNAGSNATAYAFKTYGDAWLAHLPGETQRYVASILEQGQEVQA